MIDVSELITTRIHRVFQCLFARAVVMAQASSLLPPSSIVQLVPQPVTLQAMTLVVVADGKKRNRTDSSRKKEHGDEGPKKPGEGR